MKTFKKILFTLPPAGISLLLMAAPAMAEITNPVLNNGPLQSNSAKAVSGQSFAEYFVHLWGAMLAIGGILVLIFFIWGALEWITSGGDKGHLENARNRLTQSALGMIILVGSFVLIGFLSQLFFGDSFQVLNINLPNAIQQ